METPQTSRPPRYICLVGRYNSNSSSITTGVPTYKQPPTTRCTRNRTLGLALSLSPSLRVLVVVVAAAVADTARMDYTGEKLELLRVKSLLSMFGNSRVNYWTERETISKYISDFSLFRISEGKFLIFV